MASGNVVRIDHVALYVNDLELARRFFVEMLGGKANDGYHNPQTGFRSYFISFEDGGRLEIMNRPELADIPKPANRTGYAHLAFSVGGQERVDELTKRMASLGYKILSGPRITGDGCYESCIVALEGNLIELTT